MLDFKSLIFHSYSVILEFGLISQDIHGQKVQEILALGTALYFLTHSFSSPYFFTKICFLYIQFNASFSYLRTFPVKMSHQDRERRLAGFELI